MARTPRRQGSGRGSSHGRVPGCVWRWCGERVLLLGPSGTPHELVGRVAVIWSVLDVGRTHDSILSAVEDWLGAGPAAISMDDIVEGVDQLRASSLVIDGIGP